VIFRSVAAGSCPSDGWSRVLGTVRIKAARIGSVREVHLLHMEDRVTPAPAADVPTPHNDATGTDRHSDRRYRSTAQ